MTPLSNHIVIKQDSAATMTPGGLYVPDTSTRRPHRGTVLAVGAGKRHDDGVVYPPECRAGDVVLYAEGTGIAVNLGGQDVVVVSEDAIYLILERA